MTKKFKAKNMEKLDNPVRRKMLPPHEIVKGLNVESGKIVADIGCGTGYFTIPFAKDLGEEGKVYAVDINPLMLEETNRRVEEENLRNVETIQSSENDFGLKESSVDVVFTSTVFHEVDLPEKFLDECKRVLKENGDLIILDWNSVEEEFGPPIHKRIDIEIVKKYVTEANFNIKEIEYIGKSFYIVKCSL
ncbi:class I SAM-dependent methyltransferase [Wukongibacter baidiensis]|uniref:class I SAM-dependent methyltransferase n=1 Tax=Wukongibacter baidiensis TaxID=1723361 RepID=UPI003D7F8335